MSTSLSMTERSLPIELDAGISNATWAMAFTGNGEYLVSGGDKFRAWRVEDGKQVANVETGAVDHLSASKDGKWIAAGVFRTGVLVWDATTFRQVWKHSENAWSTRVLDFSPDSTRLVSASFETVTISDHIIRKQIQTFRQNGHVLAAKYSPQLEGDRIATASDRHVRIWDSNDCRQLIEIEVRVTPVHNTGLVWSNEHLFVISDSKIKQFDASNGSIVSGWSVPDSNEFSCIALPRHGEYIAYSTKYTVTFWDTLTHSQLGLIRHTEAIRSIAFSPDDCCLAIGKNGKISIESLSRITPCRHPAFRELAIRVDDASFDAWRHGRLEDADTLLTAVMTEAQDPVPLVLASRALVRARLRNWDGALIDAEKAIKVQPSVIGYIAKSMAHIGNGERNKAYRTCDLAFACTRPSHVNMLLLIKAIIVFIAGKHLDAISRMDELIDTVNFNSTYYTVQANMYLLIGNSQMKNGDYQGAIRSFERARAQLRPSPHQPLLTVSLITGWKFDSLDITIRQGLCEALYSAGRAKDAGESLIELVYSFEKEVYMHVETIEWISNFTQRCLSAPQRDGDPVLTTTRQKGAPTLHANPTALLWEWAKATLLSRSWKEALVATVAFTTPRSTIYRVMCEHLEAMDRISYATECFRQMVDEMVGQANVRDEQIEWIFKKLENLGDNALSVEQHNDAITYYSAALALDPPIPKGFYIKRSKAYATGGLWEASLNDANKVTELDPSSPLGYERRHAALHGIGDYENAIKAFETMLSKMPRLSDKVLHAHDHQYVDPEETRAAIEEAVQDAIQDSPRVLIDTISGRLRHTSEQADTFKSLPVFNKLVSSMTTHIDRAQIKQNVTEYFRYGMFSHKWEHNEPLFKEVVGIDVYELEESLTHNKLKKFCEIIRADGLTWAWSDTCCINQEDPTVLQEALVSMFKWYQGSSLTVVYLRDVPLRRLADSIWNRRTWTLQEYHASKVVRFYNNDWTLYKNLSTPNHKNATEIIKEMEEATGISVSALMALRPGLEDIREKLRLASTRQSTRVEDAAYSLFGIFSTTSLPAVYGEGDEALGRLLAQLLTNSGDTSILAWIGKSGSFNSCLPTKLSVFKQFPTSHIPTAITNSEMDIITGKLRKSSLNLLSVENFYDQLVGLPVPLFVGKRMKLPCIVFKLGPLSVSCSGSEQVFRARTAALGIVEIKTQEDFSTLSPLYLVHPWIDFLLDRQPIGSVVEKIPEGTEDQPLTDELSLLPGPSSVTLTALEKRTGSFTPRFGLFGGRTTRLRDNASLLPPSTLAQKDKQKLTLRALARLRQPFGALLLTPDPGNVAAYRRVAAESLIIVQVEEVTPVILDKLISGTRVLGVL